MQGVYMLLRERTETDFGLLLEAPTTAAPVWCDYHDRNGEPIEGKDFAGDQRRFHASLCPLDKLTSRAELDAYLMGEGAS